MIAQTQYFSFALPQGDALLSVKELAGQLARSERYVWAMKRDGFPMPGGRATLNEARAWLAQTPAFRVNRPLQK